MPSDEEHVEQHWPQLPALKRMLEGLPKTVTVKAQHASENDVADQLARFNRRNGRT